MDGPQDSSGSEETEEIREEGKGGGQERQVLAAAVKAAAGGMSGIMIALDRVSDDPYICVTHPCDVKSVANIEKKVPLKWITDDGTGVSDEIVHYIYPLVQAEIAPLWVEGLPHHILPLKR